jgi:glycerophosphoryl diester phosphodiesterase
MTDRPPLPLVIGHRGACGHRPEHTLASYELAVALGADFIEPDLVSTRDGVLLARHENEISETTDVADRPEFRGRRTTKTIDGRAMTGWFTEDFTLAEIKTLRARERLATRDHSFDGRFEVATFEEVLTLARRKSAETGRAIGIYPETKHPTYFRSLGLPLEETLVETLHRAGYAGRSAPVFLQSFETGNLRRLRGMTDLPLIQLLEDEGQPWDLAAAGDPRTYGDLATPAGLAAIATYADGIGPSKRLIVPLGPEGRLAPPTALVDDAHRAGLLVHPWTFRSDAPFLAPEYGGDPGREYAQFFALGVDGLFSDFPGDAMRARLQYARRSSELL